MSVLKFLPHQAFKETTYKTGLDTYKITVNLDRSLHKTEAQFLSVAFSPRQIRTYWGTLLSSSDSLTKIAESLAPCDFRLGGTSANFLIFDPDGTPSPSSEHYKLAEEELNPGLTVWDTNYILTGAQWTSFHEFLKKAGLDLVFDVNVFRWRSDGLWDSTNAELLLNYSSARGLRISYFTLGNEPSAYWGNFQFRMQPDILVRNLQILKDLISKYPLYTNSKVFGPDVSNIKKKGSSRIYTRDFVAAEAYNVVDQYSFHHYHCDGKTATAQDFLNSTVLDALKESFDVITHIIKSSPKELPFMLTETSSCYGGGARDLSDRYIAGFMWLDMLGVSAQYGVTRVFRQTITGGSYGLFSNRFKARPDYFLSVLYKRLIEGSVFNVTIQPANPTMRVYAHCARIGLYEAGALVVYYLNLDKKAATLSLDQFAGAQLDLYLLTPGDADGVTSKKVKLNGKTLAMTENFTVPLMPPIQHKGDVTVEAQTFGFIVVPDSKVQACMSAPSPSPSFVPSVTRGNKGYQLSFAIALYLMQWCFST